MIGVFGGTFDPIHNGHIALAKQALEELSLEKVIFMPAFIPPHKRSLHITDDSHRYEMVKEAIKNMSEFEVSDLELKLMGNSYTARTLTILSEEYDNLVFILGADSYMSLDLWYHPEIIFSKAKIACAVRDDVDMDALQEKSDYYAKKYNGETFVLHMPKTDISSTQIRNYVKEGKDVSEYIPAEVLNYIKTNKIYL